MIEKTSRIITFFLVGMLISSLIGCSAATQFTRAADRASLVREDITVDQLPLVIFRNHKIPHSSRIHFYFDGDGSPWINGVRVAKDPTSRSQIILDLMAEDSGHKILIGRPCYYIPESRRSAECNSALWTSHRYSIEVVAAMVKAVQAQLSELSPTEVVFIGYSGGGTLAMLVAKEIESVDVVITIAANLDVDAWIKHHRFSQLSRSLNATNFPLLSETVKQWHFVGGQDKNVLPEITESVVLRQADARLIVEREYSHECCWPKDWASRLRKVISESGL